MQKVDSKTYLGHLIWMTTWIWMVGNWGRLGEVFQFFRFRLLFEIFRGCSIFGVVRFFSENWIRAPPSLTQIIFDWRAGGFLLRGVWKYFQNLVGPPTWLGVRKSLLSIRRNNNKRSINTYVSEQFRRNYLKFANCCRPYKISVFHKLIYLQDGSQ